MIGVKRDCFAYDCQNKICNALRYLYCKEEECSWYKTKKERCKECKEVYCMFTCEECKMLGIK